MRKVANAFGQDAKQRDARLESTFCVIGMEVFTNADAPDRRTPVAELGEAPLRIQASKEGGT